MSLFPVTGRVGPGAAMLAVALFVAVPLARAGDVELPSVPASVLANTISGGTRALTDSMTAPAEVKRPPRSALRPGDAGTGATSDVPAGPLVGCIECAVRGGRDPG